jgi:hypothetical protein
VATPVDQQGVVHYNGVQPFPIMHTEQDTFNALKRHPFHEVRAVVRECNMVGVSKKYVVRMVNAAGWTQKDYMTELAKKVNK